MISLTFGLWQAVVHHAGPPAHKAAPLDYYICGAEAGVAQSAFVPITGAQEFHIEFLHNFALSGVHLHPIDRISQYQLLHLAESCLSMFK